MRATGIPSGVRGPTWPTLAAPGEGTRMSTVELLHAEGRIALEDELTLGRAGDNDVVLTDERASPHHARIRRRNDVIAIEDLGSRHGTYLNGERLGGRGAALEPGDSIEIGGQRFRFLGGQETRVPSAELPV